MTINQFTRNNIRTSVSHLIENNNLQAANTCMRQVTDCRTMLSALYADAPETQNSLVKADLKNLYRSTIFPVLKSCALQEVNARIAKLNLAPSNSTKSSSSNDAQYELTLAEHDKNSIETNDNKTVTGIFKKIMYAKNGIDAMQVAHHPKLLKKSNTVLSSLHGLIDLFIAELFLSERKHKNMERGNFTSANFIQPVMDNESDDEVSDVSVHPVVQRRKLDFAEDGNSNSSN